MVIKQQRVAQLFSEDTTWCSTSNFVQTHQQETAANFRWINWRAAPTQIRIAVSCEQCKALLTELMENGAGIKYTRPPFEVKSWSGFSKKLTCCSVGLRALYCDAEYINFNQSCGWKTSWFSPCQKVLQTTVLGCYSQHICNFNSKVLWFFCVRLMLKEMWHSSSALAAVETTNQT